MLNLLRRPPLHVTLAVIAGLLLRLWFIHFRPVVDGDTLVYGEIARNWFFHGIYGFARVAGIRPTLIRLPGYPLFVGLCFLVFGVDHYTPILMLQAVIDLATCLLAAGFVLRTVSRRAAIATLWLGALCPFTANYVASPLTETLTLFTIALGLYALARYTEQPGRSRWIVALACSISYAALLRPDGALLGVVLIPAMYWYTRAQLSPIGSARRALLCLLITLVPFAAWTIRNRRTMHVFQPLAPRYANDPQEFVPHGWIRWVRTWSADYVSTSDTYWSVNGSPLDLQLLPARAFESTDEKLQTVRLFAAYNRTEVMTPWLDEEFSRLAARRIAHAPFRYYVRLPLTRLADMMLRPRTEQLWLPQHWWRYRLHPEETLFSWAYAALNLFYFALAAWGVRRRIPFAPAMLGYCVLRSLLLLTLEAPEPRYTLEFFPVIFIFAAAALVGPSRLTSRSPGSSCRS